MNEPPPKVMKSAKKTKEEQKKADKENVKKIQKLMAGIESKARYECFAVPSKAVML